MSFAFAFANNLGEKVLESYDNPYDAYQNRNNKNELCLISENKVINILDTKIISIKWAVSCSKHVLHIFEEQYPDDKRPRKAIEAVSNWIKDPSAKNRWACIDASNTARVSFHGVSPNNTYYVAHAASKIAYAAYYCAASKTAYAAYYYCKTTVYVAANASPNKLLEIKWQRY